jgi:hypothetical protein
VPTDKLTQLLAFRAVHPLYGAFLVEHLGLASRDERVQIFESVLELPRPLLKFTRVPWDFTPGPLQTERLDAELLRRGLIKPELPKAEGEEDEDEFIPWEDRPPVLADKVRLLFDATHPDVLDVSTTAVWAAGEVLAFGGNFNAFITHKDLAKQEGIIFRHLLRMILLTEEFAALTPPQMDPADWQAELKDIADKLTEACRQVDPTSTDKTIKNAHAAADVVAGEVPVPTAPPPKPDDDPEDAFAAGLVG